MGSGASSILLIRLLRLHQRDSLCPERPVLVVLRSSLAEEMAFPIPNFRFAAVTICGESSPPRVLFFLVLFVVKKADPSFSPFLVRTEFSLSPL